MNIQWVRNSINEGNEQMMHDLRKSGLTPIEKNFSSLEDLKGFLPAIVSVNIDHNGHVLILDKIDEDYVTIRDPYHGWMVDVKKQDFRETLSTTEKAIYIKDLPTTYIKNISQSNQFETEPERRFPPTIRT